MRPWENVPATFFLFYPIARQLYKVYQKPLHAPPERAKMEAAQETLVRKTFYPVETINNENPSSSSFPNKLGEFGGSLGRPAKRCLHPGR